MQFRRISDFDLGGKRVFIRADLNVPLDDNCNIGDDSRIRAALPTLQLALERGAAVMVCSHLGRPAEGEANPEDSLAPVAVHLENLLGRQVPLIRNWLDGNFELEPGSLVVLENCRLNKGEKANSPELAAKMARLCDIYVNDACATAHRRECTLHALALAAPASCAGPLLSAELDALHATLEAPERPLLAIVGGSKVSTKLRILENLAGKVDELIVGGGIANTFLLAAGYKVGSSLVEADLLPQVRQIIETMQARGARLTLPLDLVVAREFAPHAARSVKRVQEICDEDMILDIGPETSRKVTAQLRLARSIVWNGPLGVFEFEAFAEGTRQLARAIAESSARSLAGGGDTLAAIAKFGVGEQLDYISNASGAFLEFLEGRNLPAIEALQQRANH